MSAVVFSYSALVVSNRETRASYRLLSFHFRIIHGHYPPFNVLTSLKVAKKRHNKRNNHLAEDNNYHDERHQSESCQNPNHPNECHNPKQETERSACCPLF